MPLQGTHVDSWNPWVWLHEVQVLQFVLGGVGRFTKLAAYSAALDEEFKTVHFESECGLFFSEALGSAINATK